MMNCTSRNSIGAVDATILCATGFCPLLSHQTAFYCVCIGFSILATRPRLTISRRRRAG